MTDQPLPITIEVVFDDGVTRIERVLSNGREVGTNTIALPSPEEQAAVVAEQVRLDTLQKLLDPNQPDPDVASVLRVLAFGAYADKRGTDAAAAVTGELAAVPVDPKGGVTRGVLPPDA